MRRTDWAMVVAAGLVVGCGNGGPANAPKVSTKQVTAADATDPAMVDLVRRTTAATTIGAASAPVELRFEFGAAPVAGQPVDVQLSVLPQAAVPTLRVELRAGNELRIVAPEGPVEFDKVQAGTIETVRVQAVPEREGTTTLRAVVTLEQPTGEERRTFDLPIVVPAQAQAPAPATAAPVATTRPAPG